MALNGAGASASDDRAVRAATTIGAVLGIGIIGGVDEIAFHQLLQWHHFSARTTPFWQIASDGFFHLFTLSMLVVGVVRLWQSRRLLATTPGNERFWGSVLLGMGGFQILDGLALHKALRLHQVREGIAVADLLPYDLGWNASGALLLVAGWGMLSAARAREGRGGRG